MTPFVLMLAATLVAGAVGWVSLKRETERRTALIGFAAAQGWTFEAADTAGLVDRWSDPPFGVGHSRRVSNVLSGLVDGRPMVTFDYRYKVTTDTGKSRSTRTYHHGVTVIGLPACLPALEVAPEGVLTRLGNALGLDDVELESEEFNRAFRVRGPARLAHDVLTPRTMELLLRGGCGSWRLAGSDIIGWDRGRQRPADVIARVATLTGIVEGIPSFVWSGHGYDPGGGAGTPWGRT